MPWFRANLALWVVFVVVWLAASRWTRKTVRRESRAARLRYVLFGVVAGVVWSPAWIHLPWLDARLVPEEPWAGVLSLVLTALGIAFAFWARAALGKNWSGTVTVKEDHELVQRGPYALVRHPIYTGALVGLAGTAVADGHVRAALAVLLIAASFRVKLATEERFMTEQFGPAYDAYRQRVKMLVPFVW